MKTKYKFIYFELSEYDTKAWYVKNNNTGAILATIFWYAKWKQYVFTQYMQDDIFSVDCLLDIIDFMKQLH